jgi:hypothetical protein
MYVLTLWRQVAAEIMENRGHGCIAGTEHARALEPEASGDRGWPWATRPVVPLQHYEDLLR